MSEKLKKGWTRADFGDVVKQVRDRVDPESTDLERYVAGEHMDSDELRIQRWGSIGDGYLGPAFHMRFRPGHVLYGSRRTYLRKVAVADFEGITANTTFVLETKDPDILLQEILPFIMQTESFNNYSIKHSKGSVNPYINFSDLAKYEFALPPLEEQRRMNIVISQCYRTIEALKTVSELLMGVRRAMQNELLFHSDKTKGSPTALISEIADINPSDPPLDENTLFVPMESVTEWKRTIEKFEKRGDRGGIRAAAGDVLMARITPCLENGKIAQVPRNVSRCGGSTEFIVFRAKHDTDISFLYWLVSSDRIRNTAIAMMSGSTGRQRVSGSDLGEVRIPRIPYPEQVLKANLIDTVELNREALTKRLVEAHGLYSSLINNLLGRNEQ